MKILALGDTHNKHCDLTQHIQQVLQSDPDISVIVHTGDATHTQDPFTNRQQFREFANWFCGFEVPYRILVPGTHDVSLPTYPYLCSEFPFMKVLVHQGLVIDGITFFGSPFTPSYHTWAYDVDRNTSHTYWSQVPDTTDVLITHGPAYGIGDKTIMGVPKGEIKSLGDAHLLARIKQIEPKCHIFGHFHDNADQILIKNYGTYEIPELKTQFYNVSVLDTTGNLQNLPTVLEV